MSQKRYNNWQDFRLSDINNRKDLGVIPAGRWRGFDKDVSSSGTSLVLSHTATGYNETDEVGAANDNLGVVKTAQGVMVVEDAAINITVTNNSGGVDTRIDLVVLQHSYVATPGGVSAGYSVLLGTVGSGVPPAIPFPLTTIVLGTITWPAGGTDIGAGSTEYVQAPAPVIGGGDVGGMDYVLKSIAQVITGSKQIYDQTGKLITMTYGSPTLTALIDSNYYYVANIDSDYHTLSTVVKPTAVDLTHFTVHSDQKFKIDITGNILLANGSVEAHIDAGETFEFYYYAPLSKYVLVKGDEVSRSRVSKLFAAVIGNKTTASLSGSTVTLGNGGSYQELTIDLSTHPIIDHLSGNSGLWDGTNTITKGGHFVVVRVTNSAGSGWFKYNSLGTPSGANKPIRFCYPLFGDSMEFSDGYSLFVENEADWTLIGHFDGSTDLTTLFAAIGVLNAQVAANTTDIALGAWTPITLTAGWTAGIVTPECRVDGVGRVYIRGYAVAAGGATSSLGTLPSAPFYPVIQQYHIIAANTGSGVLPKLLIIDSSGSITANPGSFAPTDIWHLEGVPPYLNS